MNRTRHSAQFKQEAVEYAHQHPELTGKQISGHLGVGLSILHKWQYQQRQHMGERAHQSLTIEQQRLRAQSARMRSCGRFMRS